MLPSLPTQDLHQSSIRLPKQPLFPSIPDTKSWITIPDSLGTLFSDNPGRGSPPGSCDSMGSPSWRLTTKLNLHLLSWVPLSHLRTRKDNPLSRYGTHVVWGRVWFYRHQHRCPTVPSDVRITELCKPNLLFFLSNVKAGGYGSLLSIGLIKLNLFVSRYSKGYGYKIFRLDLGNMYKILQNENKNFCKHVVKTIVLFMLV